MPRHKKENTELLYFSVRLTARLNEMLTARTTLISAPAGYGKTTAARDFFSTHLPRDAVLLWFNCIDELPSSAWKRFCRIVQRIDAKTGSELLAMGLPDDDTKGDAVSLLLEMECAEETFLVADDFQYIKSGVPGTVWNALLEHGAKNLHTVILTRDPMERRLTLKPGVAYLGQETLRLTESEIGEYFAQSGVALLPEQIREVSRHTGGWIVALHLQLKSYITTGSFTHTTDIHRLIEEIVWDKLTDDERGFLIRISPFDSYTLRQAAYMMGADELPELVKNVKNSFIRQEGTLFHPHSTLLDFVRGIFGSAPENERREILSLAGDWCAGNGQPEQAIHFYYSLGDYEKILSTNILGMEFERTDGMEYADMLLDILENTTAEMKLRYSENVLKIIFMLFGAGRYEEYERWCNELNEIVAESSLPATERTMLSGELALLVSFSKYNNIAAMGELMRQARELFSNRPSIINMNDSWTFGNASVLFMYHSQTGRLDAELADMDENCAHYFALTRGHGSGGDVLMKAEACFNRGEMDHAAILAHKALYNAENNRQECVCIGAALLLGRLAVHRGDIDELITVLERRIPQYAEQNPLKSNRMEADLAAAYLFGLLDRPHDMPEWLRNGEISEKRLFVMTIPYAQVIFGKYLISTGKPEIWLGMEDSVRELSDTLHCLTAKIYANILSAAAWRAQGQTQRAAAALKTALDLALPDKLYMPFAENLSLLGTLLENCSPAHKHILALAEKQESGKAAILRGLYPPLPFGFTKREFEVAKLAQTLSNPEIAERLSVSRNTIKGYMKNIYQKMQISSRAELRKFLEKT